MSQLEKFTTYTPEAARKARSEEQGAGWLKLKPGTNIVRLLPPMVGMDEPWITIHQHFIKAPGGSQIVFNCPRRMENKRCPACEKADKLKASGNPADEKLSKEFWAAQRNIAFAIDRDEMDKGVQMFAFGATIKTRLRHFREKLNKNYTDFRNGFDIVIERVGQGLSTEYQADLGEQCPITQDMKKLEEWVADLPDLKSFAKVLDYDAIVEKFAAVSGAAAPPSVTTKRPSLRAASTTVEDADDDAGDDPY